MQRLRHVWIIWFAFAFLNLIIRGVLSLDLGVNPSVLASLRQGHWICFAVNTLYMAIFANPWSKHKDWLATGAPFFSLAHLVLNLLGILVYYQIGGLEHRLSGLGFVAIVLVHLIFVKWALLSILRPHLRQDK
ncbi:MAG: hypothetical protein EBS08_06910 [Cytophagia bacterium]|nr:hypothetical protein [Cytophagia bacterium]